MVTKRETSDNYITDDMIRNVPVRHVFYFEVSEKDAIRVKAMIIDYFNDLSKTHTRVSTQKYA